MTKKEKVNKDVRPHVLYQNYDYTEDGASETSPGGGLYHGNMGKYKSVSEFLAKRRKERKKVMDRLND